MVILIIEGADLVGKSTLAERVRAMTGWLIIKIRWDLRGDPEIETRAMAKTTIAILQATQPDAIFDRSYFSWWSYGPVLGYDVAYMPELMTAFARVPNARLVLLTASDAAIRRRFDHQPDLYFPLEVILGANTRFPALLPLLPDTLPRLHIDTTNTPVEDTFTQVAIFLRS
jgi:hypothetical protein